MTEPTETAVTAKNPAAGAVAHTLSDAQIEAMPVWRNFVGLWPESRREIVDAVVDLLAAAPAQAQAEPKSGAKSFQTYGEANAYSKGYYAGKKAATQAQAQAGAVPLTSAQIEAAAPEYSVDDFLDFNAGVRFAERHHGITGGQHG